MVTATGGGVPVPEGGRERPRLRVPFVEKDINLAKGIEPSFWQEREAEEIELFYQVTALPWPKNLVPQVKVKAFHNKNDIYFYLEWKDDTEDRVVDIKTFSDACALMYPMEKGAQTSSLMMGFLGKANIWQWKASQDKQYWLKEEEKSEAYTDFQYPFEQEELFGVSKEEPESAVTDLLAIRVGTLSPKPAQKVAGRGIYEQEKWTVVFKRSLQASDKELDAQFSGDTRQLCALAIWNGTQSDRGGRKSISDWVELEIQGAESK